MSFKETNSYYRHDGSSIQGSLTSRPHKLGPNSDLYDYGLAQLWIDTPNAPSQFYNLKEGDVVLSTKNRRAERLDYWDEWPVDSKRETLLKDIISQIPQHSATDIIVENTLQEIIDAWADEARSKQEELNDTPDDELDDFNPKLFPPSRVTRMRDASDVAKATPISWAILFRGWYETGKLYLSNTLVFHDSRAWVSLGLTEEEPNSDSEEWFEVPNSIAAITDLYTLVAGLGDSYKELENENSNQSDEIESITIIGDEALTRISVLENKAEDTNVEQDEQDSRLHVLESNSVVSRQEIANFLSIRTLQLCSEGTGASDPVILGEYNCASVTHTDVGVYEIILKQNSMWGHTIGLDNTITIVKTLMPSTATAQLEFIDLLSIGHYRVRVYAIEEQSGGKYVPIDLQPGDYLDIIGVMDIGDGTMPPV